MYTVRWKRSALNELAALWTEADSATRQALTAAANQVDQQLRRDPNDTGESRTGDERIYLVFPLGIEFEVDTQRSLGSSPPGLELSAARIKRPSPDGF